MSANRSVSRRLLLLAASNAFIGAWAANAPRPGLRGSLEALRARVGGRIGVQVLDTGTGRAFGFDQDTRYAMASTFKLMLVAAVLSRVDAGKLSLAQSIAFEASDLVTYSPVMTQHLQQGRLELQAMCSAAVEVSDNTAANLLLRMIGGPAALTGFMRSLGDRKTRLDRVELELNSNLPGDPRDTTTPRAMVASMRKVLLGNVLSEASRALLTGWMVRSATGLQRIRGGLPASWQAGDKTGTGANGAVNDIAILWPPARKPILAAVYMSESPAGTDALSAAHAHIGRLISDEFVHAVRT